MHPLFKIDIPKRSSHCIKGGERLIPGMDYYSLLLDEETQKMVRQDFCPTCWQQAVTQGDLTKNRGHWQSRVDAKHEKGSAQSLNKIEKALSILKESQAMSERNDAEIFVLALYLARARQLILRKEMKDKGSYYNLYEIANQDEFLTIKKVDLSGLEINTIQQSLSKKLCMQT